jgi:hypothetical protein
MNVLDVNTVNLRNLYPTAIGQTVSQSGTSANQSPSPAGVSAGNASPQTTGGATPVDHAASIGGQSSAIVGGLVFLALLVGLMFFAKRVGSDTDFSNIKLSAFNVLVISLAALIGLPVWKYLFTRFPVPALSTWALAA